MPKMTLGCSLTCLVGAYAAIRPDDPFDATVGHAISPSPAS